MLPVQVPTFVVSGLCSCGKVWNLWILACGPTGRTGYIYFLGGWRDMQGLLGMWYFLGCRVYLLPVNDVIVFSVSALWVWSPLWPCSMAVTVYELYVAFCNGLYFVPLHMWGFLARYASALPTRKYSSFMKILLNPYLTQREIKRATVLHLIRSKNKPCWFLESITGDFLSRLDALMSSCSKEWAATAAEITTTYLPPPPALTSV